MPLSTGDTLGPYEIVEAIGKGGMGEVYRARDPRLGREVAIKVLPDHLASDPQRRERFEREARAVSRVNHPHICTLHDVGEQDGLYYLVMELVKGETLESRLARGHLPLDQALEFAVQIADALDKAHRHGVVHRDLKPGNIMLTKSGVKLLDFGLAKLQRDTAPASGLSQAPTRDRSLTAEGTILGTLPYIAPEQLEGKEADARTDIFALGAVVYEMVTGTKAFDGESEASLIGAIMNSDPPPMAEIQKTATPYLVHVVTRCLAKDPMERWQSAYDVMREMKWAAETVSATAGRPAPDRYRRAALLFGLAAVVIAVLVILHTLPSQDIGVSRQVRFSISPAKGTSVYGGPGVPFVVSPDGQRIVFVGASGNADTQLWLRPFDSDVAQPVAGTEGGTGPFWSPNGQWIGFFLEDRLAKVPVSGGEPQTIASGVPRTMGSGATGGATWSPEGVIVFKAATNGGFVKVDASGGRVTGATQLDSAHGESNHVWPYFLADGRHFVYTVLGSGSGVYLSSLDGGDKRLLMPFDRKQSNARYVPGFLLFVEGGALFAAPFDEGRFEVSKDTIRILDGVPSYGPGLAQFSVSPGSLAYWRGPGGEAAALKWFDRRGVEIGTAAPPARYQGYALSRDNRWLSMSRLAEDGSRDIWLLDLLQGRQERLTFDGDSFFPKWAPEGDRVVFASSRSSAPDLFTKAITANDEARQLTDSPAQHYPTSWASNADGDWIVYESVDPSKTDLWAVRPEDGSQTKLPINTPFAESQGKLSPDGRWIAYVSDASGQSEIIVARFPSGDFRQPVSVGGGTMPEWRLDGRELFYRSNPGQLMSVAFHVAGGRPSLGPPEKLFPIPPSFTNANTYLVSADGQRFLVAAPVEGEEEPIRVVLNWKTLMDGQ
jgi:eukaryotic-like serine/threonine-protein kinase